MMSATTTGFGWFEILMFVLSGGGLLGLPPAERDVTLIKGAPQQSLVYVEWAGRSPGKLGDPGIDGFVADPEVQAFFKLLDQSLASGDTADNGESDSHRELLQWLKALTQQSGCLFLWFDAPPPGNGLLTRAKPAEIITRLRVGLISNAGRDAPAVIEGFNRMAGTQFTAEPRMEQAVSLLGQPVTVHRDGDRLLFAIGQGVVERTLAGLRNEVPSLQSNPRFSAAVQRVAMPRFASASWVDVRGIIDTLQSSLGAAGLLLQAVSRGSGASAVDFIVTGTGVVDDTVIQRTFIATGGRTNGVLVLAKNPALRMDQLRHIPVDSDLAAAISLDLAQVIAEARNLVAVTTPLSAAVFDEAIKEFEAELQLSLAADVFPAFGTTWTAFNSPSQGGLAGASLIAAVEVRDPQKAQIVFERLMKLLEQSCAAPNPDGGGPTAEVRRQEFLNHTICYVHKNSSRLASLTPSFCLTRSHLMVALHPQAMKAQLRFLGSRQIGFDTIASRKLSLANQELLAATYLDGRATLQTFSSIAPLLAPTLATTLQREGRDLDLFAIPSASALVPYAGDVTLSVARQKDGILTEMKNPHIAAATWILATSARQWFQNDVAPYLQFPAAPLQAGSLRPGDASGLGPAAGSVVPAAAAQPAPPKLQEKTGSVVTRKLAPLVIRAFVPEGVQPLIPEEVFRNLAQPPSQATLQQREERRKMQEERRRERLERRRGNAPPAKPANPGSPTPIPRSPTPIPPPPAPDP